MTPVRPKIVCLIGSTRFMPKFDEAYITETVAGRIALTIVNLAARPDLFEGLSESELTALAARIDELHLRKIDLADEVLVISEGHYVGADTQREIDYAASVQKPVRWYEDEVPAFR